MASNIAVKITADASGLQATSAVVRAEVTALNSDLNKLARQAVAMGPPTKDFQKNLLDTSQALVTAKAKAADLKDQLANSQGSTTSFSSALGLLKGGLASLGIAVSIGELKAFGEAVEENAAHIQHEAEVLQLSVTAYQAFRNAAMDSGVETDVADAAIKKFSRSVAEASIGTGKAAVDFFNMGISLNQSKEAILQQVAAYMSHASAVEQDRLAVDIFARNGTEILPLLGRWSEGVDNLTAKYDAQGRMIDPALTDAAKRSTVELNAAWQAMQVAATGPVVHLTEGLTGLLELAQGLPSNASAWQNWGSAIGLTLEAIIDPAAAAEHALEKLMRENPGPKKGGGFPGAVAPVTAAPTSDDETAVLSSINPKLKERKDLEAEIATAIKIRNDAERTGNETLIKQATETIVDKQKRLDALNKPESNPAAKAAARERLKDLHEWETTAKKVMAEIDADETRQAQHGITMAKLVLTEKTTLLAEELKNHQITAQQDYDQTIAALNAEVAAEFAAQDHIIQSTETTIAQKRAAFDREVELNQEHLDKMAAAHRAFIDNLKREDEERARSWESVDSEIESAESGLVSDILTKNQSLTTDLLQLGARLVEEEIQNDLKLLTQHILVDHGMLAADQATASGGLLAKLFGWTSAAAAHTATTATQVAATTTGAAAETAAVTTGVAAQTAARATGAAAAATVAVTDTAVQTASAAAQVAAVTTAEAAKTAAKVSSAVAGKVAESAANMTTAESQAAVAATGAAAAVAWIPLVGPALALTAATTTFAALQPFVALASLDTGTNMVPRDMPAMVHAGERIIPRADNAALMKAIAGGGNQDNRRGGDTHLHVTYSPSINTRNPRDFGVELSNHSRDLAAIIMNLARDGSLKSVGV